MSQPNHQAISNGRDDTVIVSDAGLNRRVATAPHISESNAQFGERQVVRGEPPVFMFNPVRRQALDVGRGVPCMDGSSPKVTVIIAPVGYGKTVLMSEMLVALRRTGKPCIWLALDDRDNTVDNVISAMEVAMEAEAASVSALVSASVSASTAAASGDGMTLSLAQRPIRHPTHALFRGQESLTTRLDALLARINNDTLPFTLFIDNLNCCQDAVLGRLLDQLVFQTKASLQLVLSSTRELPMDTSRAQLQGLLRQFGPAELSFTESEVASMLGPELCQHVGMTGVSDITRQTEGWPAAVRMVQIILSNSSHPLAALKTFSGSDEALAHFLNRQVLSGFPPDVRDFLLCIAQLRTFCPELCSYIMGGSRSGAATQIDSKHHLAYLLERNVFVIPLDRNRSWYRLHGLFREHLLHEAEQILSLERRQELISRAADWSEKQGYWREAIDYALACGATECLCRILEHRAPIQVRKLGDVSRYITLIDTLHEQGHQAGLEAEYWFVWALVFQRRYDQARRQSARLMARVQQQQSMTDDASVRNLQRRSTILQASLDSLSDHLQEAHVGASAWLAGVDGSDDPFNLTAANCIESGYFTTTYRFVDARQAIQAAHATAFQASSAYVTGWVTLYAALIPIYEGNHATAYAELMPSLTIAKTTLGDDLGICGTMALVAAKCAAEMGLDEEARELYDFGIRTSRTHGFLETAACGLEAAILLWNGDREERISIPFLREVAGAYPPRLSLMLSCYLIRRLLVLGRVQDARDEARRIGLNSGIHSAAHGSGTGISHAAITGASKAANAMATDTTVSVDAVYASTAAASSGYLTALIDDTRLALLIARGRYALAGPMLDLAMQRAKTLNCAARQVDLGLAAATIALRTDQPALAVRHITRVVSIAARNGIVRPFNDYTETLAAIVADTKVTAWGFALQEERRFFADRCRALRFGDAALYDRISVLHDEAPYLLAQLTARELELIGYIDAGLSNQQIADRIDVALTTVKWHLQNLYAKLGAANRTAAVAKARALNLLK